MSHAAEPDSRFPNGKWIGFFLDKRMPGRHPMELLLTFSDGKLTGTGRDRVGEFTVTGRYDTADGNCSWVKHYVGQHMLSYRGFNEGKGIWGTWEYNESGWHFTGGFHIWPEGMADPTQSVLHEEVDLPLELDLIEDEKELELVPVLPR